jgi:spermidine synthase
MGSHQFSEIFGHRVEMHIKSLHNAAFGRVMVLDGVVQTTEKDEFIHHEMLAHVPILAYGMARRVLIIGGGDGGMLREVLRHGQIAQVTQVEIDQQVIEDMAGPVGHN